MAVIYCPRCDKRIYYQPHSGKDFVHECDSGNLTLDQEDVLVIGSYQDEGKDKVEVRNALRQGEGARNAGQRSRIEGTEIYNRTKRGNKSVTHRQRQRLTFIELPEKDC